MTIRDALDAVVDALNPGLGATLDPRDLNPPCAWVAGRRAAELNLCNRPTEITADVYLISRDVGTAEAIDKLGDMLDDALDQLAAAGIGVVDVALDEAVTIPSGAGPLPAYRISTQVIGE